MKFAVAIDYYGMMLFQMENGEWGLLDYILDGEWRYPYEDRVYPIDRFKILHAFECNTTAEARKLAAVYIKMLG